MGQGRGSARAVTAGEAIVRCRHVGALYPVGARSSLGHAGVDVLTARPVAQAVALESGCAGAAEAAGLLVVAGGAGVVARMGLVGVAWKAREALVVHLRVPFVAVAEIVHLIDNAGAVRAALHVLAR